jgi:hypothetical protein
MVFENSGKDSKSVRTDEEDPLMRYFDGMGTAPPESSLVDILMTINGKNTA